MGNFNYNFVVKYSEWNVTIFKWNSIFVIENELKPFQIISRFFISSIKWWSEQFKPRNNVKLVSKTVKKCLYMLHCFSLWCLFRFGYTTKSHAKTHSARTWVKRKFNTVKVFVLSGTLSNHNKNETNIISIFLKKNNWNCSCVFISLIVKNTQNKMKTYFQLKTPLSGVRHHRFDTDHETYRRNHQQ